MLELVRILDKLLKEHFTHAEDRQEKRADEDYDEVCSFAECEKFETNFVF